MNLKRALEILDGGSWVSIRFVTANVMKGSGGKVVEIAKCRVKRRPSAQDRFHFTRQLSLPNSQIRECHPILITHLNQEELI